jgi:hypothetical protein
LYPKLHRNSVEQRGNSILDCKKKKRGEEEGIAVNSCANAVVLE